jgi:hypothetical protein
VDLDIGGYGSDAEDRAGLVAVARGRASDKHGAVIAPTSTVLIGDTLRDVQAARGGGAYVVGVAIGPVPAEDLARIWLPRVPMRCCPTYATPDWWSGPFSASATLTDSTPPVGSSSCVW